MVEYLTIGGVLSIVSIIFTSIKMHSNITDKISDTEREIAMLGNEVKNQSSRITELSASTNHRLDKLENQIERIFQLIQSQKNNH